MVNRDALQVLFNTSFTKCCTVTLKCENYCKKMYCKIVLLLFIREEIMILFSMSYITREMQMGQHMLISPFIKGTIHINEQSHDIPIFTKTGD